jgi:hypothetical protein
MNSDERMFIISHYWLCEIKLINFNHADHHPNSFDSFIR